MCTCCTSPTSLALCNTITESLNTRSQRQDRRQSKLQVDTTGGEGASVADDVKAWVQQQAQRDMLLVQHQEDLFTSQTLMHQPQPGVKYKERYDEYGYSDIYGCYDRTGRYRVNDIFYNTPDDNDDDQQYGNDSCSMNGGGCDDDDLDEEEAEDDESSGEYPPDYFDRNLRGMGACYNGNMYGLGGGRNTIGSSSNNNNNGSYSQLQTMQQAMTDIRAVLARPTLVARDEGADAIMQVAMIRAIIARSDGTGGNNSNTTQSITTTTPTVSQSTKRTKKEEEPPVTEQPVKKKLKLSHNTTTNSDGSGGKPAYSAVPEDTVDRQYMSRVNETDCFNCVLCDPFKLKEIKLPAWKSHCASQIHCTRRDNETKQQSLYGC